MPELILLFGAIALLIVTIVILMVAHVAIALFKIAAVAEEESERW